MKLLQRLKNLFLPEGEAANRLYEFCLHYSNPI